MTVLPQRRGEYTLYLAGPMAGFPEHNYPLFTQVAGRLRKLGYTVLSPHEVPDNIAIQQNCTDEEAVKSWARCIVRDLHVMFSCNAIALLPGWERSRGATLEVLLAKTLGFTIFTLHRDAAGWYTIVHDRPLHRFVFEFLGAHCLPRQE